MSVSSCLKSEIVKTTVKGGRFEPWKDHLVTWADWKTRPKWILNSATLWPFWYITGATSEFAQYLEKWYFEERVHSDGRKLFAIKSAADPNLCLDVDRNTSPPQGVPVWNLQLWECKEGSAAYNQEFGLDFFLETGRLRNDIGGCLAFSDNDYAGNIYAEPEGDKLEEDSFGCMPGFAKAEDNIGENCYGCDILEFSYWFLTPFDSKQLKIVKDSSIIYFFDFT